MSKKRNADAEPAKRENVVQKIQLLRQSNAAGPHFKRNKDRANAKRKAVSSEIDSH